MIEFTKDKIKTQWVVKIKSCISGIITSFNDGYVYNHNPDYKYILHASDLRAIADKLDELKAEVWE